MSLSTQEQKTLDLLLKKKYGDNNQKHSANPNQGMNQKHSAKPNQGKNQKHSANPNQGKNQKHSANPNQGMNQKHSAKPNQGMNQKHSAKPNQGNQKHSANLSKDIQSLTNKINGLEFQLKNIPNSGPQIPPRPARPSGHSIHSIHSIPSNPSNPSNPSEHTIFRCPEVTGTNHSQKVKNYVHLCRSFTYGGGGVYTCKFGDRCHFYHPDPRNMCPKGANCIHRDCRNFHPHQWYKPK